MDRKIVDVNELHVEDIPIVGGKGANLGELTNAGFPVPEAFVLTTESYDYFVKSGGLMPKVAEKLEGIDRTSDDSLAEASAEIRAIFESCDIPADLKKEIISRYRLLVPKGKVGFVAVRSSATAEDLPDASFAGQQETYLNVADEEDLLDKIRKCWSSLFTARAIAYREKQGYAHDEVKLAVVVQRMVNSEFSGIMFTVDPNSGAKNIVIEGGYGLGEAIVGGEVTPDTYVVDKQKMEIIKKRISTQTWKYVRGPKGGVVKEDMPKAAVKAQKIHRRSPRSEGRSRSTTRSPWTWSGASRTTRSTSSRPGPSRPPATPPPTRPWAPRPTARTSSPAAWAPAPGSPPAGSSSTT